LLWLQKEFQQYFLKLDSLDNACIILTHNGAAEFMLLHRFAVQDMDFQVLGHGTQ